MAKTPLDSRMQMAVPAPMRLAVKRIAEKLLISDSDYLRGAVLERLKADGEKLERTEAA